MSTAYGGAIYLLVLPQTASCVLIFASLIYEKEIIYIVLFRCERHSFAAQKLITPTFSLFVCLIISVNPKMADCEKGCTVYKPEAGS